VALIVNLVLLKSKASSRCFGLASRVLDFFDTQCTAVGITPLSAGHMYPGHNLNFNLELLIDDPPRAAKAI